MSPHGTSPSRCPLQFGDGRVVDDGWGVAVTDPRAWRIRVLGTVDVLAHGMPRVISSAQSRKLLALLASAPQHRLSVDVLIDELWPLEHQGVKRATLRVAVNRARDAMGEASRNVLASDGDGYLLDLAQCEIDADLYRSMIDDARRLSADDPVGALQRFAEAAVLWRGEPFSGSGYSDRLRDAQVRLDGMRVAAALDELQLWVAHDPAVAARRADDVVALAPLREDVVLAAMQAFTESGRYTEALDLASGFRRTLRSEMGLTPSPAVGEAEQRALNPRSISAERTSRRVADVMPAERDAVEALDPTASLADILHAAFDLEQRGDREQASRWFTHVVMTAVPDEDADLLVQAALGGSGHASSIGGDHERRRRLQIAADRVGQHARRGELVADLALESFNCRQRLPDDLRAEVAAVADDSESPGHLLAARWRVAERHVLGTALLEEATMLGRSAVAGGGAQVHHVSAALVVAVGIAAAHGDLDGAERWATELEYLGERTGEPRARWQALAMHTALAEVRGRHDLADSSAQRALDTGRQLGMPDAEATFGLHLMGRAFRTGSLAGFAPALGSVLDRYRYPVWAMLRAIAECDAGNERVASSLLRQHLDDAVEWIDHFLPATLALAARVAARVGDTDSAARLRPLVERRSDSLVFIGYGGPCIGPLAMYRGELARALGDPDAAARCADDAVARCRSAGAFAWVQSSRGTSLKPADNSAS